MSTWKGATAKKTVPRSPPPPPPPASEPRKTTASANATREEKYVIAAFDAEVDLVRTASEGDRNNQLNRSAFALGRYIGGGVLVEAHVVDALRVAARQAGLSDAEIDPTLLSGLTSGKLDPRTVPEPKTKAKPQNDTQGSEPDEGTPNGERPAYEEWGPDTEPPPPLEEPTAAEPLRGLEYLGKVALVGRDRILELASTPVQYVWMDIAVAGTIVLIAGPPAEGKTTLLFLILAARMNPGEVVTLLGRAIQPAEPGKWVVLIEGEHSEASTGRKLVKSLKLLGLDDAALDRVVIVARKAVRLGSPEWSDVVRMVRAGLVSDIAIDTVARVAPADADNEREQVAVFDAVAQAIEAAPEGQPKPIVWAVAHTRKANNRELADVSGSAQRTGQSDTVLMIKGEKVDGRTVSTKVTFAKLREDPDDYPMPVEFAIEKDADGALKITTTDGKTVTDDRPLETRIIESLRMGSKTKTSLSQALKRSDKDVDAALSNLFAARAITTTYVKVRGKDCKAFELRTDVGFE